ncbi:tail fiber domain-containing protein, partial [Pseudomonas viridiflava]
DYRLKKYIKDFTPTSFLDRIDAYRIVTYQRKVFGDVFRGDGTVYQGLIAHEAKEVNPLAASGEKDGVDENGNARIQQLDPMALITDLMGAIKELRAEVIALKASMQPAPEPAAA